MGCWVPRDLEPCEYSLTVNLALPKLVGLLGFDRGGFDCLGFNINKEGGKVYGEMNSLSLNDSGEALKNELEDCFV